MVHGELRGYTAHLRNKEEPCESCRRARAKYDWERWNRIAKVRRDARIRARARYWAARDIRLAYPEEFQDLLAEKKASVALTDPRYLAWHRAQEALAQRHSDEFQDGQTFYKDKLREQGAYK